MKVAYWFVGVLFFVFSLQSCATNRVASTPKVKKKHQITCESIGKLKFDYSLSKIEEVFGKENTKTTYNELDHVYITTIHEGTPQELVIEWFGDKSIPINGFVSIMKENSPYRFKNGIGIGTHLNDIYQYNGEDMFFGDFDYGGIVISGGAVVDDGRLSGNIAKECPCFKATVANKYMYNGLSDLKKNTRKFNKSNRKFSSAESKDFFIRGLFFEYNGEKDK